MVLNAIEITFRDVTITAGSGTQKASVSLNEAQQTATLTVPNALPAGPADIHITYAGILNDKLRGFYLSTEASGRRHAVTQLEATDARRAFPSFDEPALKATFDVSLTIDKGDTAISNGRVVSDTPAADGRAHRQVLDDAEDVARIWWRSPSAASSAWRRPRRACRSGFAARKARRRWDALALEMAGQILTFYNRYFNIKYPFGKLDVLAVPDFAAGAMENTAAIFYRETDLLVDSKDASLAARKRIASVLAHEMAHQWFGDLVTMKWWDDIWLNEGFATWMANHALAEMRPDWDIPVDEALETQAALSFDGLKSTHPIHAPADTPAQIDEAFDAIAYEKGAAVLRMLENYLGAGTFRNGINAYLQAHAYGNGTSQDFWNAMTAASGKPVDRILPTFVNQPGAPLVEVALGVPGQPHARWTPCSSGSSRIRRSLPERIGGTLAGAGLPEVRPVDGRRRADLVLLRVLAAASGADARRERVFLVGVRQRRARRATTARPTARRRCAPSRRACRTC